jgi:hypothetical protein
MMRDLKEIYFLRPLGELGPVKIGMSVYPAHRLKGMAIWSPVILELAAHCRAHHNTEHFLHHHFIADWMHGEWFAWSEALQAVIDHVATKGCVPDWVIEGTPTNPSEYSAFRQTYPHGKTKMTRVSRIPHRIVRAA